jgi:ABC-type uncharacterized transport system auxiliary subunit
MTFVVLSGCAAGNAPHLRFYRLEPAAGSPAAPAPATLDGVLVVERLTTDPLLAERPIVYGDGRTSELQQHRYHYWVEPPADMLQDRLTTHLRERHAATVVARPEMRLRGDWILRGRLRRFERVVGRDGDRAVVEAELTVTGAGAGVVCSGTYHADVPADHDGIGGAVGAFNRGVADILERFSTDLALSSQRAGAR